MSTNAYFPNTSPVQFYQLLDLCKSHGWKRYLDVPLTCLFLISNVGHLLLCLRVICSSFSVKFSNSVPIFLMDYMLFSYWFIRVLYNFKNISPLSVMRVSVIFPCLLSLPLVVFTTKNLCASVYVELNLSIFSSHANWFNAFLRKTSSSEIILKILLWFLLLLS